MRKKTREGWLRLVAEYRAGGEVKRVFCKRHGITPYTFQYWLSKSQTDTSRDAKLLPVVETNSRPSDGIELSMPNGITLKFCSDISPCYVAEMVNALS